MCDQIMTGVVLWDVPEQSFWWENEKDTRRLLKCLLYSDLSPDPKLPLTVPLFGAQRFISYRKFRKFWISLEDADNWQYLESWGCTGPVPGKKHNDPNMVDVYRAVNLVRRKIKVRTSADKLRDIVYNPFVPGLRIPKNWRTTQITHFAEHCYQSRDFSGLPILADMLEDVGCDRSILLDHLRGDKKHYRGCWALDFLTAVRRERNLWENFSGHEDYKDSPDFGETFH